MMTLRVRLMVIIGLSFTTLWLVTSVWMFFDVRKEFRDALDERLAASARMVAGLVAQFPDAANGDAAIAGNVADVVAKDGVACEVRMLQEDTTGSVIARTSGTPKGLGLTSAGYRTRTIDGKQWRSYTYEHAGTRVTTADRVERRQHLLRNIIVSTIVPFLVAMAGSLVVLWFGIRKGLAPLDRIQRELAERRPDALEPVAADKVPGEIGPLVAALNNLLGRTRKAIERERRFTGDAAHELRTPLTAMKTHIQVARLTSSGQANMALDHAEQAVLRLQHTLEQLLMLARVEGPFAFEGEPPATAMEVIERVKESCTPEQRHRIVAVPKPGTDPPVAISATLAFTALRNLVDNALRYSPDTSEVRILIEEDGTWVRLVVLDDGQGMNETERDRAPQRFWRSGRGTGTGLGLSIVEAIAKRFGGSFTLEPRSEGGTRATLSLPHGGATGFLNSPPHTTAHKDCS